MIRRLLAGLAAALISFAPVHAADVKISNLPAASALDGSEQLPCVQAAATDKCTTNQIKTFTSASPALVTPNIGVATATSVNKVALTAPATSATLTIANGKTLTASNSLTLAGTDSTTMTFPASSDTVAGLGTAQTFTAAQTNSNASAASAPAAIYTGAIFTGGSGTTTFPHVLIQPTTATASTTWSTSGTAYGINAHTGIGNLLDLQLDGASRFKVTASGVLTVAGNINANAGVQINFANATITAPAAGTLQAGAADAAAPAAQTLAVQSVVAGTSNTAGQNFTIAGSRGTGTGAGGDIIFQTAPAGSTGTSQNTLVTAFKISKTGAPVRPTYTVSTLPTSPVAGEFAYVSDAVSCTFLSTPTGGSNVFCPVIYNGSAWVAG